VTVPVSPLQVRPNFDPIGVWWITSALVADALIGNLQEKLFHQYGSSANEMMACSNVWAALLSLLSCAIDGSDSLWAAYDQLVQDHWIAASIIAYSALNVLGIYFIIVMITMFGATITTFTTSLRKALSVVLSFVVYAKPFAWGTSSQRGGSERCARSLCELLISAASSIVGYLVGGLVTAAGIAATMRASALKRQSASSAPSSDSSSTSGQTESVELRPLMQQLDRQFSSGSTASASSPALPTSPMNRIGDATDSLQRILVPDANMSAPASPEQPRSGWALARKSPSMSQFQVNERLP
jgi:hypothetical protein